MADGSASVREAWGSRVGFILAAAGSAVGLGNVWRFPYMVGNNGGAAFVLVYLLCIALVGVPVFLAELAVGRRTQRNPVGAFRALRPGSAWPLVGGMGVLTGFLILSFYSVVAGWTVGYTLETLVGSAATPAGAAAGSRFAAFAADPRRAVGYHALFMLLTIVIVARGVRTGIERASKVMMPVLFGLLLLLIVWGLLLPGAAAGVEFLLRPDLSRLTPAALLAAMGQAFFTLSLGMGAMITYGSYLSREHDLVRSSAEVAAMDTLVAVCAGFAIFPAVFALGMEPAQGPGLVFVTLPAVFAQIPGGWLFGTLFFFLMFLAALTSSISLLEVCSAYFIDERGWARRRAAWLLGTSIYVLGVPAALSMGPWAGWSLGALLGARPGEGWLGNVRLFQLDWFGLVEHLTSDYMLPLGGLLIALFVGWLWEPAESVGEVRRGRPGFRSAPIWVTLLRYVCPVVVGQLLLMGVLSEFLPVDAGQPAAFPKVQALADRLPVWFATLDVVLVAGVMLHGLVGPLRRGSGAGP